MESWSSPQRQNCEGPGAVERVLLRSLSPSSTYTPSSGRLQRHAALPGHIKLRPPKRRIQGNNVSPTSLSGEALVGGEQRFDVRRRRAEALEALGGCVCINQWEGLRDGCTDGAGEHAGVLPGSHVHDVGAGSGGEERDCTRYGWRTILQWYR